MGPEQDDSLHALLRYIVIQYNHSTLKSPFKHVNLEQLYSALSLFPFVLDFGLIAFMYSFIWSD